MGYREISESGVWETTLAMKEEIKARFGEKAIAEAQLRLCRNCTVLSCFLFPICTDGKDCPYFKSKEKKK